MFRLRRLAAFALLLGGGTTTTHGFTHSGLGSTAPPHTVTGGRAVRGRSPASSVVAPRFATRERPTPEAKKSWSPARFLKTALFFRAMAPPSPAKLLRRALGATAPAHPVPPQTTLFYAPSAAGSGAASGADAAGSAGASAQQAAQQASSSSRAFSLKWGALDDVVMGGRSLSTFDPHTGLWEGDVTTEGGGGFAGVRTRALDPPLDMEQCRGIRLVVQGGGGRRFKLIVRDDDAWNGVAWSHSFDTKPGLADAAEGGAEEGGAAGVKKKGATTEVFVPFSMFVPTRFARVLDPGKPLAQGSITAFQLAYSKFEYDGLLNPHFTPGPFALTLESLSSY